MSLSDFEEQIGVTFNDKDLLQKAFTHRSYINEHRGSGMEHNERLEFLGDAVLELAVTRYLFDEFPNKPEGDLTAYRSSLVNTQTLASLGEKLNFNNFLLLSKGEARDTGRARSYILADTFEALLGSIYMDQGYDVAQIFVSKHVFPLLPNIIQEGSWIDGKSMFQEKAQEFEGVTPVYETLHSEGPDHNKQFTVGVFLHDKKIAEGSGKSKQEAEQEAAREGLKHQGWI